MRRAAALVAALAAASGACAPAQAATISPRGARFAQAAMNAQGRTVVAWERRTRRGVAVEVRIGRSAGRLGRRLRVTERGASPRVAVGADGTAAMTWVEYEARGVRSLHGAIARPGRGFGRLQVLDRRRANMGPVGVAVQPGGRVVAVWQRQGNRLGYALAGRSRSFGRARNLATIGPVSAGSVALDPRDGAVVVAHGTPLVPSPPTNQQAAVRTQSDIAGFSAPTILTPPGAGNLTESHPRAIAGPAGAGVVISSRGDSPVLSLARRAADGTWPSVERIATAGYGADVFPASLTATLPQGGSAVAAWSIVTFAGEAVRSSRVVTAFAPDGGAFAAPLDVETVAGRIPSLALVSAGAEVFLATARPRGPVHVRVVSAGGLGPPRVLAQRGDGDVVLAAGGDRVIAVYQVADRLRLTRAR